MVGRDAGIPQGRHPDRGGADRLVSFFVGIADIKDKIEAKREEEEERREAERSASQEAGSGSGGDEGDASG